jgi:hypothetical protein
MTTYRNDFINIDSFEPAEEERRWVGSKNYPDGIVISNGTVEVTLWRKTRRVAALRRENGRISARGLVGRYVTGTKSWPAHVETHLDGATVYVHFGRDDRSGRFSKANCLHFA